MRTHLVKEEGLLLECLLKNFPGLKRTKVKQLLKYEAIIVNGRAVTRHDHPLRAGDKLFIRSKPDQARPRAGGDLSFPIVHEDRSILVVDKPAGLLTMGTDTERKKTCYYELTEYVRTTSRSQNARIFIVHRLDRDASGLLVFAKSEEAKHHLQKNWETAEKKYYALVEGTPAKPSDTIESYLVEDKFRRVYSTRKTHESKLAVTRYRTLSSSGKYSLLEVTLVTGRKNQIRVHLADQGHPIIGDVKYGSTCDPIGRLGLHAFYLSFTHPSTLAPTTFTSSLPAVFKKVI